MATLTGFYSLGVIRFSMGTKAYPKIYTKLLCLVEVHTFLLRISTLIYFKDHDPICFIDGLNVSHIAAFFIGCGMMLLYLIVIILAQIRKSRVYKRKREIKY